MIHELSLICAAARPWGDGTHPYCYSYIPTNTILEREAMICDCVCHQRNTDAQFRIDGDV